MVTATIAAFLILFSGLNTFASAASKMITVHWLGTEMNITYEPDSKFVVGKQPSSTLLKSEAKGYCARTFGWTMLGVFGASGRAMGDSGANSKLVINQSKIIKGKWQLNDNGEDEYSLTFSCYGSLASPVTANSKAYSVTFYYRSYDSKKKQYFNWGGFSSPYYTIADLNSVKWVIDAELGVDDQFNCCGVDNVNTWNPIGTEYP
jgi:hypothetical protein